MPLWPSGPPPPGLAAEARGCPPRAQPCSDRSPATHTACLELHSHLGDSLHTLSVAEETVSWKPLSFPRCMLTGGRAGASHLRAPDCLRPGTRQGQGGCTSRHREGGPGPWTGQPDTGPRARGATRLARAPQSSPPGTPHAPGWDCQPRGAREPAEPWAEHVALSQGGGCA